MRDLWAVEFSLMMEDVICNDTPRIDGKMIVRGEDIFQVLENATNRLNRYTKVGYDCVFGYDRLIIHGAKRCDPEKTKGETENE